jgi:hypothetical protein
VSGEKLFPGTVFMTQSKPLVIFERMPNQIFLDDPLYEIWLDGNMVGTLNTGGAIRAVSVEAGHHKVRIKSGDRTGSLTCHFKIGSDEKVHFQCREGRVLTTGSLLDLIGFSPIFQWLFIPWTYVGLRRLRK